MSCDSGESHRWRPLWPEQRLVPMGSIHFHLLPPPPLPPAGAAQRLCCVAPKQGLQLQPRGAMGARRKHTRGEQRLVCCRYQFQPAWLSAGKHSATKFVASLAAMQQKLHRFCKHDYLKWKKEWKTAKILGDITPITFLDRLYHQLIKPFSQHLTL